MRFIKGLSTLSQIRSKAPKKTHFIILLLLKQALRLARLRNVCLCLGQFAALVVKCGTGFGYFLLFLVEYGLGGGGCKTTIYY